MDVSEAIAEELVLLWQGVVGAADFRTVLEALSNIDIVYGSALRGATTAYHHSWFVQDKTDRKEQLLFVLREIAVWIYRGRALPERLMMIFADDVAYHDLFVSRNIIPFRRFAMAQPHDYSSLANLKDLYDFFTEEISGCTSAGAPAFANAPG